MRSLRLSAPMLILSLASSAVSLGACAQAIDREPETAACAREAPAIAMSDPDEYGDHGLSRAAGERYFAEIGLGDPYATGIPYPVMLAMMRAYPDLLGADFGAFAAKFGFYMREDGSALPIGFHLTTDPITRVPFVVMTCQTCHAERLRLPGGDVMVSSLGNKRVRMHAYDAALMRIAQDPGFTDARLLPMARAEADAHDVTFPGEYARLVVKATIENLKKRASLRAAAVIPLESAMPGRVAVMESFAVALAAEGGHAARPFSQVGWSRVPDVRAARYKSTLSFDGAGTGAPTALSVEADLAVGARAAWFDSHRHIGTSLWMYLRGFERKLPFPGPIDRDLARRGHDVFVRRCAGCHGRYEEGGAVAYEEKVVPLAIVGTDPSRANAVTPELVAAANAAPLAKGLASLAATGGYVAPPLVDVWMRAPYGHAGQWATLAALATKPDARPVRYVVMPSAPYDLDAIGVRTREGDAPAPGTDEYVYDGRAQGYDAGGHPFVADLGADSRAVLEYLKGI